MTKVLIECKDTAVEKVVPYCEKVVVEVPEAETACIPVPEEEHRVLLPCTETVVHHARPGLPPVEDEDKEVTEEEEDECDCPCFEEVEIFDCGPETNFSSPVDGSLVLNPLSYCAKPLYFDEFSDCTTCDDSEETERIDLPLGAFLEALEESLKASDGENTVMEDMFVDTMEMIEVPLL
eukprot:CAMPEP_0196656022 /NCGR_PEP_ID=MMETSP1086-20130531/11972_1 /TAXON_ID=77921 /ORGANISM="Cyanoptyche  gloeocystis , Strain SAG4.97" /LENGTH=178 /DNA_ID=CAMNT_0041988597 /DNA_START=36 /DNA_END=572 /DNA_ORIENTATION=+